MKKSVSVVLMLSLVGAMLFGLTACGNKDEEVVDETLIVEEDTSVDDTTIEDDTVVEDDTAVEDDTMTEVDQGVSEVAGYTALNQKGIDALDAMFADGSDTSTITAQSIVEKMKEVYGENYLPSMSMDEATFNDVTGLTSEDYVEFVAETPMISAHVDSLFVVKAADGKVETVKTALENYRTTQIEGAMQYPMNMPKLEASQVVVYDDYVIFIMLGGYIEESIDDGDVIVDEGTVVEDGAVVEDSTVTDDTTVSEDTTSTDTTVDVPSESTDTASDFS